MTATMTTTLTTSTEALTYHWDDLVARVGEPTAEEKTLYALATPDSELVALGRRISSTRVLTDMLRWLGMALDYFDEDTGANAVLGVSKGLLRVMVSEGISLRSMVERHSAGRGAQRAALDVATDFADREFVLGSGHREQLRAILTAALRDDPAHHVSLEQAYGSEHDHRALAQSLRALIGTTRQFLAQGDQPVAKRLADGGISPDLLAAIEQVAGQVESMGELNTGARTRTPVSQAELDTQDGRCLTHMRHLRDLFGAAHDLDPIVPRLVPIATRNIFAQHHRRKAEAETPVQQASPSPEPKSA